MNQYPQADTELKDKVWQLMQFHRGYLHRIDRNELTTRIFGKFTDTKDRKVRDALSELPVVWDDGYFIPLTREEAQGYISGMKSRQAAIQSKLHIIDDYLRHDAQPVKVEQIQIRLI